MKRINRVLWGTLLTLTVLAFIGQVAMAGPGCKGLAESKHSCGVKTCDAKVTCASATKTSTASALACCADGKKCTKEDCIKKCLEMGMTQKQAEECWANHGTAAAHGKDGQRFTKEDCIKKCTAMGMTTAQAEEMWAKHQKTGTAGCVMTASATSGCPMSAKAATNEPCTKEQCVAKLMADGLSKKDAEAKYAACMTAGKCSGKVKGGACCASLGGKK
jgi:hypothetical protein